jgi:hypothetical protein
MMGQTMPGFLIEGRCRCGYVKKNLFTGADFKSSYIISYTDSNDDLITIKMDHSEVAKNKTIDDPFIEDPFLEENDSGSIPDDLRDEENKRQNLKGPYQCPRCKKLTLLLNQVGNWD